MKYSYHKIDLNSFERIWDSGYKDKHIDSWPESFKRTDEKIWKPVFEKWLKVMNEIQLDEKVIGYIFLSPKYDSTAHLGYGLYREYRGKGLISGIIKDFLKIEVPRLNSDIQYLIGTTLKENLISQKVLLKQGFLYNKEVTEFHHDKKIEYYQYRKALY